MHIHDCHSRTKETGVDEMFFLKINFHDFIRNFGDIMFKRDK